MNKYSWVLFVAAFVTSGCSNTIDAYQQTIQLALSSPEDVDISIEELQTWTVPVLYLRPNDRGRVALVAVTPGADATRVHWISADQRLIELTHGRITKLYGFHPNFDYVQFSTPDLIAQPITRIRAGQTSFSVQDWSSSQLNSYPVKHEILEKTTSSLEFFNTKFPAVLVKEQVTFPDGSQFVNQFWFDGKTGQLLQSIQKPSHFSAEFELIEISKITNLISVQDLKVNEAKAEE